MFVEITNFIHNLFQYVNNEIESIYTIIIKKVLFSLLKNECLLFNKHFK